MPEVQTSPELKVLVLLLLAFTLFAWWLSERQARRFRKFANWVAANYSAQWQALPWVTRHLNRVGGIEVLRRNGLGNDPQFMAQYQQGKMVRWPQVAAACGGVAAIGLIIVGVEYLGWTW